jgi:hypothetical protein
LRLEYMMGGEALGRLTTACVSLTRRPSFQVFEPMITIMMPYPLPHVHVHSSVTGEGVAVNK